MADESVNDLPPAERQLDKEDDTVEAIALPYVPEDQEIPPDDIGILTGP